MTTHVPAPPTGEQFTLHLDGAHGPVDAAIVQVAAGLRHLTVDGQDLVQGYGADTVPPFATGIVLVPWPNRVRDGVWSLHGKQLQLDITEPDKNNAIHGLLRNTPYRVVERSAEAVTLAASVLPQHGYPFHLETTVTYRLTDDGIRVEHGVTNVGAEAAPYAVGTHPFLRVGAHPVDELTITARTVEHVAVDARLNPTGLEPAAGGPFDLSTGRLVADLELDDAWRVEPDTDGVTRTRLSATDGAATVLWQEGEWEWLQVFITRTYPTNAGPVTAIAVEPMTAPADALVSGQGLRWLAPGESWSGAWGIARSA
ncbi:MULTISPECIES: aldose 1-epimerase family protein [Microcella]|uniref:aldose 1-epimerase family protein n=1 Tax=Microcella TaxID=337004 RepID=UPI0015CF174B|nr:MULTISPECIES: aldose 1-epimerase family protein [Microcella]QOD93374.1 aldose 1-epimerase family protein [Chryseoglobus sp. 28M-23]